MKIIGVLLILCSAFFLARGYVTEIEESVRSTCALRQIMENVKNMIECYAMPIGQILKQMDPEVLKLCGYSGDSLPCDLLELLENSSVTDGESREIFFSFSKDFGKGYRKDELLRCSMFLERMRSREKKLLKEAAKKKRVVMAVSLCGAAAVVILLI